MSTQPEPATYCAAIWNGCECIRPTHDDDRHVWRNTLPPREVIDPAKYPATAAARAEVARVREAYNQGWMDAISEQDADVLGLKDAVAVTGRLCRRRSGDPEAEECGLPYHHGGDHHPRALVDAVPRQYPDGGSIEEVVRRVNDLPAWMHPLNDGTLVAVVSIQAVLALLEDAAPRQPEWPDIPIVPECLECGGPPHSTGCSKTDRVAIQLAEGEGRMPNSEAFDEADNMCPNCITPWKCNGPHLSGQTVAARRHRAPAARRRDAT